MLVGVREGGPRRMGFAPGYSLAWGYPFALPGVGGGDLPRDPVGLTHSSGAVARSVLTVGRSARARHAALGTTFPAEYVEVLRAPVGVC